MRIAPQRGWLPMMSAVVWTLVWTLVAVILAQGSGCAFLEKRSSLRTAVDTYTTTLSVLAEYRAAGMLSEGAVEKIDGARKAARAALDEWRECLKTGQPVSRAIADWTEAMAVLIEERVAAEGGE